MSSFPQRYLIEAKTIADEREVEAADLPPSVAETFLYWQSRCGDGFGPAPADFRLDELPFDILPMATLVDVRDEPLDFVYRFWGSGRTEQQGADYTGRSIRAVEPGFVAEKIWREYTAVHAAKAPRHFISERVLDDGTHYEYHFIRLPLSRDGSRVAQIFCTEFGRAISAPKA
jgi:hypothetical protein